MEYLFDESEQSMTRYVCLATDEARYDFSFVYSSLFQGKSFITCLQSGQSLLLSHDDLHDEKYWVKKLAVAEEDVDKIKEFFAAALPAFPPAVSQYD
ncbi:SAV0927 family protein [Aneurinibacillus sp. REN35]|uniref:SAV0927 family protein n=1 Tax=Aneurinibacillus sp. REN35 TaxID=3237286 RepID=UPI003528F618